MIQVRKRFGQHFLHDPAVLERIAQAVNPRPGEHLVEIGPGPGALTVKARARKAITCRREQCFVKPSTNCARTGLDPVWLVLMASPLR